MYFTEMRWLSRSTVLTRFFELKQKRKLHVPEPDDPNGAMVLSHIFHMPNLLNQKLHGLNQVVTAAFGRVNAFATTTKLRKAELSEEKTLSIAQHARLLYERVLFSVAMIVFHHDFNQQFLLT